MGGLSNRTIPGPHVLLNPKPGTERSVFQIPTNRLKVVENINSTHFKIHWLVVKWCDEQSCVSFVKAPNE